MDKDLEKKVSENSWFAWSHWVLKTSENHETRITKLECLQKDISALKAYIKITWALMTTLIGLVVWLITLQA